MFEVRGTKALEKIVLFLCTGNYYRSRFAEILFNVIASRVELGWRADSRGVALEKGINNRGPISQDVLMHLKALGISMEEPLRNPIQATENDFLQADLVIALKEDEHRPYVFERYPNWVDRIFYWDVDDIDQKPSYESLLEIEEGVRDLVKKLQSKGEIK